MIINPDDDIPAFQTRFSGRTFFGDTNNENPSLPVQLEMAQKLGIQLLHGNPQPAAPDFSIIDQLKDNPFRMVDGNGKTNALGFLVDSRIDSYQRTIDIQ